MSPWVAGVVVLLALGGLLGAVGAARVRGRLSPEIARKTVHAGLGTLCACFPFLFQDVWPVLLLAGTATAAMAALRVPLIRSCFRAPAAALHDVERESLGELWFPVAVAAAWWLSKGDWRGYSLPVLILAWADAAAALTGRSFGRRRYTTDEGRKSWEGSGAFFVTAAALAAVFLYVAGWTEPQRIISAAIAIGLFTMATEAVARNGSDNLLIPLACWAQLVVYDTLSAGEIAFRAATLAILVACVRWRTRCSPLNDGALFAAYLGVYIFGALFGIYAALPAMLCLAVYALLNRVRPVSERDAHDTGIVFATIVPAVAAGVLALAMKKPGAAGLIPVALGAGAAVMTCAHLRDRFPAHSTVLVSALAGIVVSVSGAALFKVFDLRAAVFSCVVAALLARLVWSRGVPPVRTSRRFLTQAGCGLAACLPSFAALFLP